MDVAPDGLGRVAGPPGALVLEPADDADALALVVRVELDDSSMNRHGLAGRFGHGSLLSAFVVSVQAAPSIAGGQLVDSAETLTGYRRPPPRSGSQEEA